MTHSYIESDGGKLAVDVAGEGPLVICSPAMGDTRDAFGPLAAQLVDSGFRVACVDLRGHGESAADFVEYGDEATARDLLATIEEFGEPAFLAGASMSAAAAVIAAGRRPDRVAGLILLGPFLRNGTGSVGRWLLHLALARPWGPAVWRFYAARLWPGLGRAAAERATTTTDLLTRPDRWAAFHATTATDHRVAAPWLGRVQAPVLVVMGEADPDWKDPRAEAAWVASNFTDVETVMVPTAGHAPMLERPDIVGPAVARFMEKVGRTSVDKSGHA